MNDVTEIQNAQQTAFEGPLSLPATCLLAIVLVCVFAWSLYRERHVLGARTTTAFAILRLICLATVLWMLLAPTRILIETTTTQRSIAIVTDTSASMNTVDPPGTADEVRWLENFESNAGRDASTDPSLDPTALADRALASLGVADNQLADSIRAVSQHRADQQIAASISATQKAISRSQDNIQTLLDLPLGSLLGAERENAIKPVLRNASKLLGAPEFQNFKSLAERLAAGRTPRQPDWRESLNDLQYRLRGSRGVLIELSN